MYAAMFTYHNLLPDEVGRQRPQALFDMLDTLSDGAQADIDGDEYLQMFYGR